MPNARHESCDSVGQWILFCVSSLLSYGRQRDFYMLLNCVRAQKSIIQLPSLGEHQYNNGYIGGTERTRVPLEIWKNKESFYHYKSEKKLFLYLFLSR